MSKKRISIYPVLLVSIFCFHLINNYLWLRNSISIEGVDVENHLLYSIQFFYRLSDVVLNPTVPFWTKLLDIIRLLNRPIHTNIYWPSFVNLCAAAFYSIFGRSLLAAKLTMLPFFLILLVSTYLIGKEIANRFVGLCAAFMISMYPIIFESSRQYALDLPLTALVALTILFLLYCDNFKNRKYTILLALSCGIGMLIKGQLALFIIGPICLVLFNLAKEVKKSCRRWFKLIFNLFLFIIIAILISSIWWGNKIGSALFSIYKFIYYTFYRIEEYSQEYVYSVYLPEISRNSVGFFFSLIFLIALIFFIKARVKYKGILISWILFPFLLFSFLVLAKQGRFLMPLLPGLALISAWGVSRIKIRRFKYLILGIIVIFGLTQFFTLSYCSAARREISLGPIKIFGRSRYGDLPYYRDLKINEIIEVLRKGYPQDEEIKVGSIIFFNDLRPGTWEMLYWLKLKDRFIKPIDLVEMHSYFHRDFDFMDFILFCPPRFSRLSWPKGERFRQELRKTHFLNWDPAISIEQWRGALQSDPAWFELLKRLEDSQSEFEFIKKIEREDGFRCYIYKRR